MPGRIGIGASALVSLLFATMACADDLPGDVQHYINRQKACNYWTSEPSDNSHRREEIARHLRELNCKTMPHDEAVLRARYPGSTVILDAMDAAQDAFPDQ